MLFHGKTKINWKSLTPARAQQWADGCEDDREIRKEKLAHCVHLAPLLLQLRNKYTYIYITFQKGQKSYSLFGFSAIRRAY